MKPVMHSIESVSKMITAGKRLLLAGDESLFARLPKGQWIGGSGIYFMTENGGEQNKDQLFVSELPSCVNGVTVKYYDKHSINRVYADMYGNGYSVILLPAFSATHHEFALHAPTYPCFAAQPLLGYITGVGLDEVGRKKACVIDGTSGEVYRDGAVVMHVKLPDNKAAQLDILNMFEPGDGDVIEFGKDGFEAHGALINGKPENLAAYLTRKQVDLKLPLVADYAGAMVNTSFQHVDSENGIVKFYAPVFQGAKYHVARQSGDYVQRFTNEMSTHAGSDLAFSCNCILNYVYAGLEGRKTGEVTGPITFGEVAYQLLNQTMVYLRIVEV